MNPDTPQPDKPAASPSLQALLSHIEPLLPNSQESSVSTVELYLDAKGEERLIITGLRYPSGNLGQVRFDYRAPEASRLIDLDLSANTMTGYDIDHQPAAGLVERQSLDVEATAPWLDQLVSQGSVQNI